jgi:hypothetical protein
MSLDTLNRRLLAVAVPALLVGSQAGTASPVLDRSVLPVPEPKPPMY